MFTPPADKSSCQSSPVVPALVPAAAFLAAKSKLASRSVSFAGPAGAAEKVFNQAKGKPLDHYNALHRDAMAQARAQAAQAAAMGEVPVGAVILYDGQVLARAHNRREIDCDPLAHAELIVLHKAAKLLGRWRLTGCSLVVTLEPCAMCAGAIVNSRIDHVVFGAWDARAGAVGSLRNIVADCRLNHRAQVTPGVQAELARAQLQQFFAARRQAKKRSGL